MQGKGGEACDFSVMNEGAHTQLKPITRLNDFDGVMFNIDNVHCRDKDNRTVDLICALDDRGQPKLCTIQDSEVIAVADAWGMKVGPIYKMNITFAKKKKKNGSDLSV